MVVEERWLKCDAKKKTIRENTAKSVNNCKLFEFCEMCALEYDCAFGHKCRCKEWLESEVKQT